MKKSIIATLSFILLISCGKEESATSTPEAQTALVSIFDAEVGDKWTYRHMNGYSYHTDQDVRCYTNDTLILEVMEILNDEEIVIREYLSPNSDIFTVWPDSNYIWGNPEAIYDLSWKIVNGDLVINDLDDPGAQRFNSHLYLFDGNLPLTGEKEEEVVFGKWKPVPLLGDFCNELIIFDKPYTDLIVDVENGNFAFDGNGYTLAYNANHGIVRSMTYGAWFGDMAGWDRIE